MAWVELGLLAGPAADSHQQMALPHSPHSHVHSLNFHFKTHFPPPTYKRQFDPPPSISLIAIFKKYILYILIL